MVTNLIRSSMFPDLLAYQSTQSMADGSYRFRSLGLKPLGCRVLTETRDDFCPVNAFSHHLIINELTSSLESASIPLFAFHSDSGFKTLDKTSFLSFIQSIFISASLDITDGHSYRIGGTLKLLLDGVPPETVMKIGGWTSLCFLIYWRWLEQIIPLAITRSWNANIRSFARSHGLAEDVDEFVFRD